jgi:hypothetical protein
MRDADAALGGFFLSKRFFGGAADTSAGFLVEGFLPVVEDWSERFFLIGFIFVLFPDS